MISKKVVGEGSGIDTIVKEQIGLNILRMIHQKKNQNK